MILMIKRRAMLFKTLQGYGIPVQFSVFECEIDEENLIHMKYEVEGITKMSEDSVIYYNLCPRCINKTQRIGIIKKLIPDDIVVI
jgi:CRISPR-associated protein Cas2